jgi:hypothetical protein
MQGDLAKERSYKIKLVVKRNYLQYVERRLCVAKVSNLNFVSKVVNCPIKNKFIDTGK